MLRILIRSVHVCDADNCFFHLKCWQFYVDTVKQMALYQFVAGSPLRTLCLLIAGQPAEVFSSATTSSTLPGSIDIYQQPAKVIY